MNNIKFGYIRNGSIIELPYNNIKSCVEYCQTLLSDNKDDSLHIVEINPIAEVYKNYAHINLLKFINPEQILLDGKYI